MEGLLKLFLRKRSRKKVWSISINHKGHLFDGEIKKTTTCSHQLMNEWRTFIIPTLFSVYLFE